MKLFFPSSLILLCLFTLQGFAQVVIAPFEIEKVDTIAELKLLKASNPKMTTEHFVQAANDLMAREGLGFDVGFDEATCQKIVQSKNARKDPNAPINLRARLQSPLGDDGNLTLPEMSFVSGSCLSCRVVLPLVEITEKDFITLIQQKNIKFYLPSNFRFHQVEAVDAENHSAVKRRWRIPFQTVPLSISDDGTILFIGFEDKELADLTLLLFSEGTFQFAPRSEMSKETKVTSFTNVNMPQMRFIKFQNGANINVIRFADKCP